jgi:hypothetical protein
MKLGGRSICAPSPKTIVIPREDENYVFKVGPVAFSDFETIYPEPTPPIVTKPGGQKYYNVKAPAYVEAKDKRSNARIDFIVVKSLSFTEGLEWEKVDPDDINTWGNWKEEMMTSGLTEAEIGKIFSEILKVNSLTDTLIDDSEKGFLPIKDQVLPETDQVEEPAST